MKEIYERLPLWLRWTLFLPLSILITFLAVLLLSLLRNDFNFIHSAVVIVSFSFSIYMLAPRWESQLVIVSLILRMIITIGIISFIFIIGEVPDKTTSFEIFRELFGWIIGWCLYFLIFKNKRDE